MKLNLIFLLTTILFSLMILMESCSSSTLVDVWNDPAFHGPSLKKILVIAIRKDPALRRIWEDAFVNELSKYNVSATSSYQIFPDALPDTNQVIQIVQDKGFDGIITTRILLPGTQYNYVQGYQTNEKLLPYNKFTKRYDIFNIEIKHPGYVESQVVDRRAIDVWSILNGERMVWNAISNSPERFTVVDVQNDIADLVIPALLKDSIITSVK